MTISGGDAKLSSGGRAAAAGIALGVAAVHLLRLGSYLHGTRDRLYYSYASDILLPLAVYFLLCLSERNVQFLRDWLRRGVRRCAADMYIGHT